MVFLDIVLAIFLAYGLIRGIWNGFFCELASMLSLLVGIYAAIKFSAFMREFLIKHVSWNPQNVRIAAFVLTFIVVVIGITLLAKFFTTVANFSGLGLFNKLFGGVIGVIKMALIISIVLNLFAKLNSGEALADKKTTDASLLYNPIRKMAAWFYPSLEA
jgi:membrane protein required for colicin V production